GSANALDGSVWSAMANVKFAYSQTGTAYAATPTIFTQGWTTSGTLNITTNQSVSELFTVTSNPKRITKISVGLDKHGNPTGNVNIRVVRDSAGVPSLVAADTLWTSGAVSVTSIYDGLLAFSV